MTGNRRLLTSPGFWIAAAVTARHAAGAWNLRRNLRWLATSAPAQDQPVGMLKVHFVIPVLREQEHILPAIAWFSTLLADMPGSTLTIVTTSREDSERQHLIQAIADADPGPLDAVRFPELSPDELQDLNAAIANSRGGILPESAVADVLARYPTTTHMVEEQVAAARSQGVAVRHAHYDGDGRKAAQVNHAVGSLNCPEPHDYIAVYDIDSRPDLPLLARTAAFIADRTRLDGQPPQVVQQSARFAVPDLPHKDWQLRLCRGAARSQTLWTLRREITSFRRYSAAARRPTGRPVLDAARRGLAQTVGHGLLVRYDVFGQLGGFPTFTLLDDFPFGYRVTIAGIPVDCIPATTIADAPHEVRELIAQGRRWFHNYLDYPQCAARASADGHGSLGEHAVALAVAAYRGSTWLAATPAMAACIALALRPGTLPAVRLMAAAGLWLGVVTPVRMLAKAEGRPTTIAGQAGESIELLAAYMIRSAGPFAAVAALAARRSAQLSPKISRRIKKEKP